MRLPTLAAVLASSIGLTLLPAATAEATPSALRARTFTAPIGTTGIEPVKFNCQSFSNPATSTQTTISGPGTAPLGAGSLRLGVGPAVGMESGATKDYGQAGTALANLTALSFAAYRTSSYAMPLYLDLYVAPDGNPNNLVETLEYAVPTGTDWQTVDATTVTFTVLDDTGTPTGATTTLADYKTAHSAANLGSWYITNFCEGNANSAVAIDALALTDGSTDSVIDFEPASTIVPAGAGTISYGAYRALKATLRSGSTPISGATLTLWAKTYPATTYSKVNVTIPATNSSGVTTVTVRPLKNTSYQFRYAGAEPTNGAANSPVFTVNVATVLTKTVADTTVTTTQPVVVTGWTKPAKPGTYVYLYKGTAAVARATVASNGSYKLTYRIATKGYYAISVKGGAGSGNVAGATPATTVKVG